MFGHFDRPLIDDAEMRRAEGFGRSAYGRSERARIRRRLRIAHFSGSRSFWSKRFQSPA